MRSEKRHGSGHARIGCPQTWEFRSFWPVKLKSHSLCFADSRPLSPPAPQSPRPARYVYCWSKNRAEQNEEEEEEPEEQDPSFPPSSSEQRRRHDVTYLDTIRGLEGKVVINQQAFFCLGVICMEWGKSAREVSKTLLRVTIATKGWLPRHSLLSGISDTQNPFVNLQYGHEAYRKSVL